MAEQEPETEPTAAELAAAVELVVGELSALAGTVAALTERVGGLAARVALIEQPEQQQEES